MGVCVFMIDGDSFMLYYLMKGGHDLLFTIDVLQSSNRSHGDMEIHSVLVWTML